MPKTIIAVAALCLLAMAAGCQTTDDPSKGGLFSYNPEAYQQRINTREAELQNLNQQQAQAQQANTQLEAQKEQKQSENLTLQAKMADMDASIARLDKQVRGQRMATKDKQRQADLILARLAQVKADLEVIQGSGKAQAKEVDDLKGQLDDLKAEAQQLSAQ